jgi:imipenem/basic amino acid-specific outer membrane pore
MKKVFLAIMSVGTVLFGHQAMSKADQWQIDATVRAFWIDERHGGQKSTATALGGFFGGSTPQYRGFSADASLYVSQAFMALNPTDENSVNSVPYDGTKGLLYLGEAEVKYRHNALQLRAGRMKIDTPFADADDIRMIPNTFEGAYLRYDDGGPVSCDLLYLSSWAGYDSMDESGNQSEFKAFAPGSKGTAAFGVSYALNENNELHAWYYYADLLFDLVYAEATGRYVLTPEWSLEWGIQGAWIGQKNASGIDGTVTGAMLSLIDGRFYVDAAYNYAAVAENHTVTNGFGGGPYYTSLDESTIAGATELRPGMDVSVWRTSLGADISWWPHGEEEGLHVEAYYGEFDVVNTAVGAVETDLVVWLGAGEHWRLDAIASDIDIQNSPNPSFEDIEHVWVRLDYTF